MSIKSSQALVAEALKEIKTINTDQAFKMTSENQCNLIDIRDVRELERDGKVEGSNHIPRGMLEFWLDPESPYFKEGKLDQKKEIFGAPTFVVNNKIFWGQDRLDYALDELKNN